MNQDKAPKAHWDANCTTIFCEICKEQKDAGNRPTAFLSPDGYKNLARDFGLRTRKHYIKAQFKNKWDSTKSLYQAWVYYKIKATGLGWDPVKQTITESDKQWAELIKANKLIAGFRRGPPDNLELMEAMYEDAHVDGTSAVMPRVPKEVPAELVDLVDEEPSEPTPPSVNRKRGARAARIACSPGKKKKNPMQQDFKRYVDHCINKAFRVLKQKWRILHGISSYPPKKQTEIIIACLALHNFIRDSQLFDLHFYRCDIDENYMPPGHVSSTSGGNVGNDMRGDHLSMNNTRDDIANALFTARGGV